MTVTESVCRLPWCTDKSHKGTHPVSSPRGRSTDEKVQKVVKEQKIKPAAAQ